MHQRRSHDLISVDTQLENNDISWDYCTSLGVDNTNVNIGEQNSIKSRALLKSNRIKIVGCPCHILHNAPKKAGSSFSDEVGFDIEDHCVDLFYWFDKSSMRKSILKEYNECCDEEYADIIQNRSTRRLCLEKCVSRELDKFEGMKSNFISQKFSDQRFKRLKTYFNKDPMTSVYLRFYQSTLPTYFNNFNKMLQSEEPLIYVMHDLQQKFMIKLSSKFIKPEVIQISYSRLIFQDIVRKKTKTFL